MQTTMSNSSNCHFDLNCFIQGDPATDIFHVRVSPTWKTQELIQEIYRVYNSELGFGRELVFKKTRISLYQVDVAPRELAKIETLPENHLMQRIDQVKDYWPDPEKISHRRIQVLISVEAVPTPVQVGVDAVAQLSSGIDKLTLRQDSMAKGFRAAPSVSTAAYHSVFKQQQENSNIPIYNGRPYERTSIPIQLFHPAFDFFTTELEKSDELTEDKCAIVEKLMFGSQALYNTETDRWSAIKGLLIGAVGHPIFKDNISKCQSGGVVTFTEPNSARKACGAVVELKNEIGTDD
ncbi:unnamed protein product [Rhizoctonia solani]|nr:unnamed protein product [Rhizoctonia solani]